MSIFNYYSQNLIFQSLKLKIEFAFLFILPLCFDKRRLERRSTVLPIIHTVNADLSSHSLNLQSQYLSEAYLKRILVVKLGLF